MGGTYSALPEVGQNFPYCTLTFRHPDKVVLTTADQRVNDGVTRSMANYWPAGISRNGYEKDGAYEIKCHGYPFTKSQSKDEAFAVKRMCCNILTDLHSMGWNLVVTTDLSRYHDLTTWFFHRLNVERKPAHILCVSISSHDSLQLVNCPDSLKKLLSEAIKQGYAQAGGTVQEEMVFGNEFEVKLNGYPWQSADFAESVRGRQALLALFRALDSASYQFYGTANLKGTADSMFFILNESYPSGRSHYSMISLNSSDRLRLIDCTDQVIGVVRDVVKQHWQLQEEFTRCNAYEFKLKGYPWSSTGSDAVSSRHLITVTLQRLVEFGWNVVTTLDVSRRLNDKSVFVLRSCQPAALAHFCLSLNETDKLRLINAPEQVVSMLRQVVQQYWPAGVKREGDYFGSYEMKLNGNPWHGHTDLTGGNEFVVARCMMCFVLKALNDHGWHVVCSADVSSKYHSSDKGADYSIDVHSWYVAYVGSGGGASAPSGAPALDPTGGGTAPAAAGFMGPNTPPLEPPMSQHGEFPDKPPPSYSDIFRN